jgi:hypothetical protein
VQGPPQASTRLVLLALAKHMDGQGGSCWPSAETLATETGLSLRAVKTHLAVARRLRWISGTPGSPGPTRGPGWKRTSYQAQIPTRTTSVVGSATGAPPSTGGSATGAPPNARGSANDDHEVVHLVHPSRSESRSKKEAAVAAPTADPSQTSDPVWGVGLDLLLRAGASESGARGFLGKLVKEHGKAAVTEAITATQRASPADPKSYLVGILRKPPPREPWEGPSLEEARADLERQDQQIWGSNRQWL